MPLKARARTAGKATSIDIAQLAGVSQPTVSRALRGSPMVSAGTRERIETIARQLHYAVDRNASNLRMRRSNTLALLIFEDPTPDDSLINPFFHSMFGSITRACAERRYDLLISFQPRRGSPQTGDEYARKADGIILLGYGDYHEYRLRLQMLAAQGAHFVRWGQVLQGQPGLSVGCDNFQGGGDAARHLIASGRRTIAFLGHASSHYPEFLERYRGYAAAGQLLGGGRRFDAIVAASDLIAIGALRALQERRIDVPSEVAVVGFDDIPAASLASPALTTVVQDTRLAGEVLVDTLLNLIRGEPAADRILPTRLAVRRSCGAAHAGAAAPG